MTTETKPPAPAPGDASSLSPFRYTTFTVLWIATVVANIGTWMQNAAAGWLMTGLDPDPFIVSLVQVANALPMFLFALAGGALADIVDRRRLLIVIQSTIAVLVAGFGALVWLGHVTPAILLAFSFLAGTAAALIAPAWLSIIPQLVPRTDLQPAVALNGVGINVSRAVGPALAGLIIVAWGLAAPFWLNALATLGVIAALIWWQPPADGVRRLPAEGFGRAMRAGLRHARHNPHLRATLIRTAGFTVFASAYWALLPLLARDQVASGPRLYGILLGAIGAGAVAGAFTLPFLQRRFGADMPALAGTVGTAIAMVMFAFARQPAVALAASFVAGVSWIAVLSAVNISAQVGLPSWVRGRGLALFSTVLFGGLTFGSAIWGKVAALTSLPVAHLAAATGALVAIPLLWRWKLQTGAGVDFTPSMHWLQPTLSRDIEADRGPVLVTIEYRIDPADRIAFVDAVVQLSQERRRNGAFEWGLFEDAEEAGRFVETFLLDSWMEHLRQHERVTQADRARQETVNRFQMQGAPKVTHLIASDRDEA
ncbi:MAG TPA: MFS transporter [Xanthobacteraceae bacterium]